MTFDEIALEEQEHIIDELQKENKRLHNVVDVKDNERIMLVKKNKELQRRIDDLQTELISARNNYKQAHEINALYKEIVQQKTEVNRITMICEVKDDVAMEIREDLISIEKENASLKAENENLKNEIKTLYSLKNQLAGDNNNLRATIKSYECLLKGVFKHDDNN